MTDRRAGADSPSFPARVRKQHSGRWILQLRNRRGMEMSIDAFHRHPEAVTGLRDPLAVAIVKAMAHAGCQSGYGSTDKPSMLSSMRTRRHRGRKGLDRE